MAFMPSVTVSARCASVSEFFQNPLCRNASPADTATRTAVAVQNTMPPRPWKSGTVPSERSETGLSLISRTPPSDFVRRRSTLSDNWGLSPVILLILRVTSYSPKPASKYSPIPGAYR
ncbi:MAG: hypothetical protein BWY25_03231 [Chloroflexi bacterium ADurb.Bin222]|nr:MAG: hypothetical protein BWY25_03231 [Chloroflexi bacterium ADurb.Bin222]